MLLQPGSISLLGLRTFGVFVGIWRQVGGRYWTRTNDPCDVNAVL